MITLAQLFLTCFNLLKLNDRNLAKLRTYESNLFQTCNPDRIDDRYFHQFRQRPAGAKLVSADQTKKSTGIMYVKRCHEQT